MTQAEAASTEEAPHNAPCVRDGPCCAVAKLLSMLVTVYRYSLSPLLGPRCRFYPSCSQYAQECLARYPLGTALAKTAARLARCHPFHPGGVDLP